MTEPRTRPRTARPSATATLAVAISYVLAWCVGLAIGAPQLGPGDSGEMVIAAYAAAPAALPQAVLTHGVAGVLIGLLAYLHARPQRGLTASRRRLTAAAGVTATILSLAQLAGEAMLVRGTPSGGEAERLWALIAVLDGAKMLALALLIVASGPLSRNRFSTALAAAAAISLVVSGVGYLSLNPALMAAAFVSLPLLLLWAIGSSLPARAAPGAQGRGRAG